MPGMLRSLQELLIRQRQTRSAATSPGETRRIRQAGTGMAYRRAAGLLLLVNGMLWAAITGVTAAGRGVWIAALGLIPAGWGVWWISRWVWGENRVGMTFADDPPRSAPSRPAGMRKARPWEMLLLLPCAALDAVWLLNCLLSVLHQLMPAYPSGILRVMLPLALTLGVLLGKRNGAAYGVSLWRWVLPLAAVWVMATVLRNQGMELLYPLLGRGWMATGLGILTGSGALWSCALLFVLPDCGMTSPPGKKKDHTIHYVLLPLLAVTLLALTLACLGAWHAADGDAGLRLLLVGRGGGSMMLSGLWAAFWLLGLMTAYCTSLMAAQKLVCRVWRGCRDWLPVVVTGALAAVMVWVWQDGLPWWAEWLLPWRFMLWALAAAWAGIRRGAGAKKLGK